MRAFIVGVLVLVFMLAGCSGKNESLNQAVFHQSLTNAGVPIYDMSDSELDQMAKNLCTGKSEKTINILVKHYMMNGWLTAEQAAMFMKVSMQTYCPASLLES